MVIRVKILETNKEVELNIDKVKVKDLLKQLGLLTMEHIVLRNNVIVTEDDELVDGDEVVVFTIKSGG